jgi:hypothetical protein
LAPIGLISGLVLPFMGVVIPYAFIIIYKYNKILYGTGFTFVSYEIYFFVASLVICGASLPMTFGYIGLNY